MKEKVTIRIAEELRKKIKEENKITGKTETAIIEEALIRYFDKDNNEALVELFLSKFDDKYKNVLTRIRLASTSADRNIEALLNIKNSELFINHTPPDAFISTYETKHSLITSSERAVKNQIALYKQRKDNAKVPE